MMRGRGLEKTIYFSLVLVRGAMSGGGQFRVHSAVFVLLKLSITRFVRLASCYRRRQWF